MGNGAKAAMRRDRQGKDGKAEAKSQLKVNEKAKNIICVTCRTTFLCTAKAKALEEHAQNKHSKTLKECFPDFQA
jgi:hypothetical protein